MATKKSDTTEKPRDDFADGLGERPEAFIFEKKGDKLVGTVVGFSTGFDPEYRNEEYPIMIVRDEATGKDVSVHLFHTALVNQTLRADPKTGDRIGIVFQGDRKPKSGGKPYKDFVFKIDHAASGPKSLSEAFKSAPEPDADPDDDLPF